jgi:hypothetical protein
MRQHTALVSSPKNYSKTQTFQVLKKTHSHVAMSDPYTMPLIDFAVAACVQKLKSRSLRQ